MQTPPVFTRERLTGRLRGRRQAITGKVIVQVEVVIQAAPGHALIPNPPPPWANSAEEWARNEAERQERAWRVQGTFWRDATFNEIAPEVELTAHAADTVHSGHNTSGGYQPMVTTGPVQPPPRKP